MTINVCGFFFISMKPIKNVITCIKYIIQIVESPTLISDLFFFLFSSWVLAFALSFHDSSLSFVYSQPTDSNDPISDNCWCNATKIIINAHFQLTMNFYESILCVYSFSADRFSQNYLN